MAFAITGTSLFTDDIRDAVTMTDFWNVSRDVYPGMRAASTDVMLVQALLVCYFVFTNVGVRPDLKTKAVAIISRSGKRFDDGIYGEDTRAVMSLFEQDMGAPFKDGIVRTVPTENLDRGPETKLKKLNFVWNMTMLGDMIGATKKETGRKSLQPVLFRDLYRGG
jgi:hypothetical protein